MSKQGLTLIELLVVIVLLGVVSSLSIMRWRGSSPGFTFAECQYRKIAEKTLRSILSAERSYFLQNGRSFTQNLADLPITDVNARANEDFPVAYNLSADQWYFSGTARYTKRQGLAITLIYDANLPNEPRESLAGGASWCP